MNKSPKLSGGQVTSTVIDIKQDEPYTILSREIDGDHSSTPDRKAIELVLQTLNHETTSAKDIKNNIDQLEKALEETKEIVNIQKEDAKLTAGALEEVIVMLHELLPQEVI